MKRDPRTDAAIRQAIDGGLAFLDSRPSLHGSVMNRIKGEKTMNRKIIPCAVLALCILLSSLAALAAGRSYVIQYLFGKETESPIALEMAQKVQPTGHVQRSEGLVCTVQDAYFDGGRLAVGLGFAADRHVYLVAQELLVNGETVDYAEYGSSVEEFWVGSVPPMGPLPEGERIHGIECVFREALPQGETVQVTLRMAMLAPRQGVQPVDTYQPDNAALWAEIDAALAAGLTPVSLDEPWEVLVGAGWFGNDFDRTAPLARPLCDVDALVDFACMQVVDTLEITFALMAQ